MEPKTTKPREHVWEKLIEGEPMEEGAICLRCGRYANSQGDEPCQVPDDDEECAHEE